MNNNNSTKNNNQSNNNKNKNNNYNNNSNSDSNNAHVVLVLSLSSLSSSLSCWYIQDSQRSLSYDDNVLLRVASDHSSASSWYFLSLSLFWFLLEMTPHFGRLLFSLLQLLLLRA